MDADGVPISEGGSEDEAESEGGETWDGAESEGGESEEGSGDGVESEGESDDDYGIPDVMIDAE